MHHSFFISTVIVFGLVAGSCAQTEPASAPPAALKPVPHVDPPALAADKPADFPGVHNVVTYAPGLYSGSVPEGEAGFETLQGMGIRTIISVDGALPDVETAKAHGMRYVHLPIGYNGMGEQRTLEIAKAIKDLPGPVFVHCHHGKHRSAGATGAAAVTLGLITNDQAKARMKVSGTAANYTGLYECAQVASAANGAKLGALPAYFPERSKPSTFVKTMVEIDELNDQLKAIEKAGWTTPKDHADLVPASVAGTLADHFRFAAESPSSADKAGDFADWLRADSKLITTIEDGLTGGMPPAELSAHMKKLQQSCKDCHAKYRD